MLKDNFYFLCRLWNAHPTTTSLTPGGTLCSTSWRGTSKLRCHARTAGPSPGLLPALRTPVRSTPWYKAHERSEQTLVSQTVLLDNPLKWYSFIQSSIGQEYNGTSYIAIKEMFQQKCVYKDNHIVSVFLATVIYLWDKVLKSCHCFCKWYLCQLLVNVRQNQFVVTDLQVCYTVFARLHFGSASVTLSYCICWRGLPQYQCAQVTRCLSMLNVRRSTKNAFMSLGVFVFSIFFFNCYSFCIHFSILKCVYPSCSLNIVLLY